MVFLPPHRDETQVLMHFTMVSKFHLKDPFFVSFIWLSSLTWVLHFCRPQTHLCFSLEMGTVNVMKVTNWQLRWKKRGVMCCMAPSSHCFKNKLGFDLERKELSNVSVIPVSSFCQGLISTKQSKFWFVILDPSLLHRWLVSSAQSPEVTNAGICSQLKQKLPGSLSYTDLQYFHSKEIFHQIPRTLTFALLKARNKNLPSRKSWYGSISSETPAAAEEERC